MENDAKKLLEKYLSGNCSEQEAALVESWYLQIPSAGKMPAPFEIEESKKVVFSQLSVQRSYKKIIRFRLAAAAASIILCLSASLYFYNKQNVRPLIASTHQLKNVLPGRNRAILTLASGRVVDLDQVKTGEELHENGIIIRKNKNGMLEYTIQEAGENSNGTNTISTPRGGSYQVILPDGTRAWLNAATTLKYPYAFSKNERVVELNGEAYFEVTKDAKRPFKVNTASQSVEVLGTHFNINAYQDERATKTTLLEGSIRLKNKEHVLMMHPGEQVSTIDNSFKLNPDVDVEQEIAWKNNVFSFNGADLKAVMRQISRWYDLDVVFQGKINTEAYYGEIPRSSNLEEVFKILELNHIHTQVNGKVLTISGN